MRSNTLNRMLLCATFMAFVASCGREELPQTPKSGAISKPLPPVAGEDAKVASVPINPLDGIKGNIIDAQYNLKIKAGFLNVCSGTLNIKINADVGSAAGGLPFQMPDSCLSCLGAKIDISKFLQTMGGSVGTPAGPAASPTDVIHIQDGIIGVKNMGPVKFAPARPLLPSFLSLKPEELRSINTSWNTTLTNSITGETGSGNFMARVLNTDQPYNSPDMNYNFKKTLEFETTYSGFDSVKTKTSNMLLDKMGMVISLDPLAFPKIFVELNAGKMRAEMQGSGQQIDLDKLESTQCGVNSGFTKFMMGIMNDPAKLQAIHGTLGGGAGGGPVASIGKLLMDLIINRTTIVISGDLAKMEGLDK